MKMSLFVFTIFYTFIFISCETVNKNDGTNNNIAVTSIELSHTTINLKVGESLTLSAVVNPLNATDNYLIWYSDHIGVATLNGHKLLEAKAKGTANIIVKSYSNRNITAKCKVYVTDDFTVTFNSGRGSAVSPQTVIYGNKVIKPDDPTHLRYTFLGWYKEAILTNPYDFAYEIITKDTSIYAMWDLIFTKVVSFAAFSPRSAHTSVVFNNKMWVIGGSDREYKNDVWYSSNGEAWIKAIENAPFSSRYSHTSVVFDNKIWVIGGHYANTKDDIWHSYDGVNWTKAKESAEFNERYNHSSVVFDDKIWVIGGWDAINGVIKNDVWWSSNGIRWIKSTDSAEFSARSNHNSVVYDNKIWVIGGRDNNGILKNDVWYSSDGTKWIKAVENAAFETRTGHTIVVYDKKMWIIGGDGGGFKNDVWSSPDGITWTKESNYSENVSIADHTSLIYDDKIWLIAGSKVGVSSNEVWRSK